MLLGDPILPQPKPLAERSAGQGALFAVCVVLLLISTLALVASYGWGSPMWERMFYELNVRESQIRVLGHWPATRVNPGNGLLIEVVRSVVIVVGALLIIVGRFLGKEAAELLPHLPWSKIGPRRLGLARYSALCGLPWSRGCSPAHCTIMYTMARAISDVPGQSVRPEVLGRGGPFGTAGSAKPEGRRSGKDERRAAGPGRPGILRI